MSKKYNIKSTKIMNRYEAWRRAQGYRPPSKLEAIHKPTSPQAKMSKKSNIKSTKIKKFHDEWCRANGYKPSSTVTQGPKPQAKGSSFKPKSTSSRIREPG